MIRPKSLEQMQDRLINVSLIGIICLGIPSVAVSLLRMIETGWLWTMGLHIAAMTVALATFLLRSKLVVAARGPVFLERSDLPLLHHGQRDVAQRAERAAVRAVHLAHARAAVQQVVAVRRRAEHAHHHLGDGAVSRRPRRIDEVLRRVRGRPVRGPLAPHHHDRYRWALHHE